MISTIIEGAVSLFFDYGIRKIKDTIYMHSFYSAAQEQTDYFAQIDRSEFKEKLIILFSKDNAKRIKKEIAKTNSGFTIMQEIKDFLYNECEIICEDENLIAGLKMHVDAYCEYIKGVMQKYKPDEFDRVFLSDFRKTAEEQLTQALSQLTDLESTIMNSEENIIAAVYDAMAKIFAEIDKIKGRGDADKITISELSRMTQVEMNSRFTGACCFEENLYHRFRDKDYRRVSLESVYQTPKCVMHSWSGDNRKHKDAMADRLGYFKDKFSNFDEDNNSVMRDIDTFYADNARDLLSFLKIFVNAQRFRDYRTTVPYDSTDVVPTTCYIYGEAGIGKTSLTSRMCNDIAALGDKRVFFARFRQLSVRNEKAAYTDKDGNDIIINFSQIKDGDVLWLDGLDEATEKDGKLSVLDAIKKTLSKKNVRYIITSRPRRERLHDDSVAIRIAPFDRQTMQQFVQQYYDRNKCIQHLGLEKIKRIIEKDDGEFYDNYRVLTIPFILYMFLYNDILKGEEQKDESSGDSDDNIKMKLYHELLGENSYIFKNVVYDSKRQRAKPQEIRKYRDTAKDIAFEMFRQNKLFIQYKIPKAQQKNRVFEFYLHGEEKNNTECSVEFIHKSFYEYFLTEKLIEEMLKSLEEHDFRKRLNVVFGVCRIEPSLIEFVDLLKHQNLCKEIFARQCGKLSQLYANLNAFVKEFCISQYYFENFSHYNGKSPDEVAINTFANYISILLSLSDIPKTHEAQCKNTERTLNSDMSKLLRINDGFIQLRGLIYSNSLRRADLREADLRKADLREADLFDANLRGANFRGATLDTQQKEYIKKYGGIVD